MKKLFHIFGILCVSAILAAAVCSCAIRESRKNLAALPKIRVGMTKAQVMEIMGEPIKNEDYCSDQVWYYYVKPVWFDGQATRDECTAIRFDQFGRVEAWGRNAGTGVYSVLEERLAK